jgi:hypothetical protein
MLPVADLIEHGIRDAADQIGRDPQAIKILKMGLDVAHRQTGGIKADDLVIHPIDPGLAFLHQLRREAAVPVARNGQRHFAIRALYALG